MSIIVWVVTGLIAGFILTNIGKGRNPDVAIDNILTGILGALIGGFIFESFTRRIPGTAGFNGWSIPFAAAGAVILPMFFRLLLRRGERE
jgi:uncharacterized membrane protein YeaQ/YmgE (transglycosylase-associated protein family)